MSKLRTGLFVLSGLSAGIMMQAVSPAWAGGCPGNPDALGTSRTLIVETSALPRIGTMQYNRSLPLNDHEVVITFDDGPLPPYSNRILETLAAECVKATYFMVGQMARAYPDTVRKIYNAGHTIGTHSQRHPFGLGDLGMKRISSEVDEGIASVQNAVGNARAVAPFFRIPGLARSYQAESYLAAQKLSVWSADEVADDWHRRISPEQIVIRAMRRIEARGNRGVLLLHDIQPATALALPTLLRELKARGYKIVHAVPAGPRPETVPELPASMAVAEGGWPRVLPTKVAETTTAAEPTTGHTARRHKRLSHRLAYALKRKKHKTRTAAHAFRS